MIGRGKMTRFQYATKVLSDNKPFDNETYDNYLRGRYGLLECIKHQMGGFGDFEEEERIDEELLEDILRGMSEYLSHYIAIPAFKQKKWKEMNQWLHELPIEDDDIYLDEMIEELFYEPIDKDTAVYILKSLQAMSAKDGKTKGELADEIGVKPKSIQNALHLMSPSLNEKRRKKSVSTKKKTKSKERDVPRFGGQSVQVPIEYEDFTQTTREIDSVSGKTRAINRRERRYYTPYSCNPIALQLNVMQVGSILKGLQLVYDSEVSRNSLLMAVNIWTQLTEHCKMRVNENVFPADKDFHSFLDKIDKTEEGDLFITERAMIRSESALGTRVNLACKGGVMCDIKLKGVDKVIRNCKAEYDYSEGQYCLIHTGDKTIRVREDDIIDLMPVDERY